MGRSWSRSFSSTPKSRWTRWAAPPPESMTRGVLTAFVVLSWCLAPLNLMAGAETIHLKDDRTLEAQIIRQTDKTVTVDWYGVPLTYWRDAIVGIEKGAVGPGPPRPPPRP